MHSVLTEYEITLHAYCLMSNHYHLLIENSQKNLSEALKKLNGDYAASFNKKYGRSGHLWQGRFKSWLLFDETHFWTVVKYIERNPLEAGMVNTIQSWPWQSLYARLENQENLALLEQSLIWRMDDREYLEFLGSSLDSEHLESVYMQPKLRVDEEGEPIVLNRRIETFFPENSIENILAAYRYGYTKAEISRATGLSAAYIGRVVNKHSHDIDQTSD